MDILKLAESKSVIIYGAHLIALELYRYLENGVGNFQFEGFAVTSMENNPEILEGKKVRCIEEYCFDNDKLVFVAMPRKYHKDVESYIRQRGFDMVYFVDQEKMEKLKGGWILNQAKGESASQYYIYEDTHDKSWLNIAEKNQREHLQELRIHFKFPTLFYKEWDFVAVKIGQNTLMAKYKNSFGSYRNLHEMDCHNTSDDWNISNIIKIYMAFSRWDNGKQVETMDSPWLIPIQAGSILTDDKANTLLDETGDNISDMNRMLAELTIAYWVWKNESDVTYKGLCHYRRHFVISEKEIRNLCENQVDVILPTPRYVPGGVENMFLAETPVKQFVYDSMRKSIGELYPEEEENFRNFGKGEFYYPNNMVIAKNGIYDEYCSWMFPIIFRMRGIDMEEGYGHETDRHLAYAAELLTSYYFWRCRDDYKIVVTDYKFFGGHKEESREH